MYLEGSALAQFALNIDPPAKRFKLRLDQPQANSAATLRREIGLENSMYIFFLDTWTIVFDLDNGRRSRFVYAFPGGDVDHSALLTIQRLQGVDHNVSHNLDKRSTVDLADERLVGN